MKADAVNTLEGSLYYQGHRIVDDYLDSFLILTSDARYTDPWTLVVKFCWGLKLNIQSQIATMPFCHMTENTQLNNIIFFLFYIIINFLILNSCCLLL